MRLLRHESLDERVRHIVEAFLGACGTSDPERVRDALFHAYRTIFFDLLESDWMERPTRLVPCSILTQAFEAFIALRFEMPEQSSRDIMLSQEQERDFLDLLETCRSLFAYMYLVAPELFVPGMDADHILEFAEHWGDSCAAAIEHMREWREEHGRESLFALDASIPSALTDALLDVVLWWTHAGAARWFREAVERRLAILESARELIDLPAAGSVA